MNISNFLSPWFPPACISCGRSAKAPPLCSVCRKIFPRCHQHLLPQIKTKEPQLLFYSLFEYQKIRSLIYALKHKESVYCIDLFSQKIKEEFSALTLPGNICIVPIPKSSQSKRSYNQAEELIRPFAQDQKIPIRNLIERQDNSKNQKSLSSRQRLKNMTSALYLNEYPINTSVLLFDDVITTGATIRAAHALLDPHVSQIIIASLCYNK